MSNPIPILLVEDNDDDVVLIRELFDEHQLIDIIHVAPDGEAALAYLQRQGIYEDATLPNLVLLDINLPKLNGLEVLQVVKQDPNLRHVPIVMLTTSGREEDILQSYQHGASSYIRKPVSMQKLAEVAKQFSIYWGLIALLPGGV